MQASILPLNYIHPQLKNLFGNLPYVFVHPEIIITSVTIYNCKTWRCLGLNPGPSDMRSERSTTELYTSPTEGAPQQLLLHTLALF